MPINPVTPSVPDKYRLFKLKSLFPKQYSVVMLFSDALEYLGGTLNPARFYIKGLSIGEFWFQ
jgi:hypothetical protein